MNRYWLYRWVWPFDPVPPARFAKVVDSQFSGFSQSLYVLRPFHLLAALVLRVRLFEHRRLLMKLGFLKYDPSLSGWVAGYYKNMKWQWRFWRGPYRDYVAAHHPHLKPPRWRDTWRT